jgi:CDP-2,3-bis-(O-geranylgeranyl)-sn-glycerol synthase
MGKRLDFAIDCGRRLADNNRILGNSKTWRGVVGAIIVTPVGAVLLGYPASTGALIAVYAVLGDILSSFIKRRLGLAPSSMAPLLDQVPESLLPALMFMDTFGMNYQSIIILVCIFVVMELLLSIILFKLGIRKTPY